MNKEIKFSNYFGKDRFLFIWIMVAGLCQLLLYLQLYFIQNFTANIFGYLTIFFEIFILYLVTVILATKTKNNLSTSGNRYVAIGLVIGFSIIFRLLMILTPATLSKDAWRFVWDGRVTSHGVDPYAYRPSSTALDWLKNVYYFDEIDHAKEITPYPPVAQFLFLLVHLFSGNLLGLKVAATIIDIINCFILAYLLNKISTERSISHLLLYSWSPLLIIEFSSNGHIDSLPILLILISLTFLHQRRLSFSAISYALAVWSKTYPVLLFPIYLKFLKRKESRQSVFYYFLVIFLISFALLIPFVISSGWNIFLGQLRYATGWFYNASFFLFLEIIMSNMLTQMETSHMVLRFLVLAIFLIVSIFVYRKQQNDVKELVYSSVSILGLSLLLAPAVFPWYLSWILIFCSLIGLNLKTLPWIILSGTINFGYLLQFMKGADLITVSLIEYLPIYLLLIFAYSFPKSVTQISKLKKNNYRD